MTAIKFWGEVRPYGWLSNFSRHPFSLDGKWYPTNEHFFQSKKFEGTKYEEYIIRLTFPAETAREGKRRDLPLRPDWEEVKEDIMYQGLKAKFTQNPSIKNLLLATGDRELIENSPYDYYWGIGRSGTGKNRLGVLLMKLREELRQ